MKANFEYLKSSVLTSAAFDPIDSFATDGPLDVVVNMNRPWVNYPFSLATQIGVVADPDWLESGAKDHPIGTGPFVFDQWSPGQQAHRQQEPGLLADRPTRDPLPYLDRVDLPPAARQRLALGESRGRRHRRHADLGRQPDTEVQEISRQR